MMDAEKRQVFAIYIGTRESTNGKKLYVYVRINENQNNGEMIKYTHEDQICFHKQLSYFGIGTVISVEESEDKTKWRKYQYIEKWKNEDDIKQWQAHSRTLETKLKNKSEATKNKYKEVEEHIEILAEIYWKLPGAHREAFIAWILSGVMGAKYRNKLK